MYQAFYCCLETLGLFIYTTPSIVLLLLEGSGFLFILPIKLVEIPIASTHTHSLQSKGHHQGFKNSLSAASTAVTMMQKDMVGSQKKIIMSSLCRTAVIVSSLLNNAPKKVLMY